MLIEMYDIHCHVDALASNPCHIRGLISSGIKASSWAAHSLISKERPINVSLGLHPFFVTPDSMAELDVLETYLDDSAVIAMGEIGLDYHKESSGDRQYQHPVFCEQLKRAALRGLPVIIHCRKAHDALFECLSAVDLSGVVFHSFSGSEQDHARAMARGDMISFGFPITYPDNKKQRAMLEVTPMDRIMLETDAPYMKRLKDAPSTPDEVSFVYEAAANIKGVSLDDMIVQVRQNVRRIWPQFREFI